MKQKSYVMVKPEFANHDEVIELIKKRLTSNGLKIVDEGFIKYDADSAKKHYHEHVGKSFYPELEQYITSDKAYGMEVEGEDAISVIRKLVGATKNPEEGTIRYDVPEILHVERRVTENVVHASDCEEASALELEIFKSLLK